MELTFREGGSLGSKNETFRDEAVTVRDRGSSVVGGLSVGTGTSSSRDEAPSMLLNHRRYCHRRNQ
jgi:hypothetical protein